MKHWQLTTITLVKDWLVMVWLFYFCHLLYSFFFFLKSSLDLCSLFEISCFFVLNGFNFQSGHRQHGNHAGKREKIEIVYVYVWLCFVFEWYSV